MDAGSDRSIFFRPCRRPCRDRAVALAVVGISSVLFLCTAPLHMPGAPVPAFIANYQSALAINDVIAAPSCCFRSSSILRSRALLLLASAYLFTAAAAIVHALTFRFVCPCRPSERRSADHGLAVHDLARRISTSDARLCAG